MERLSLTFNETDLSLDIPGFILLSISGRESQKISMNQNRTGPDLARTYKPKEITVGYKIVNPVNRELADQYNKLQSLLSCDEGKLIFSDEPDKYWNASVQDITESKITFYCSDPFKYSVVEKEIPISGNAFTIQNSGTVPASIRYEITLDKENGYLGIASENGVMEYGKKEEADGQTFKRNEKLLTIQNFISASDSKGTTDYLHPLYGTKGTLTTKERHGKTYLTLGTAGDLVGDANGGLRQLTIPADSAGVSGAVNFDIYMHLEMYANQMGQTGEMSVSILTADNKLISALNWNKTDRSGNTANYDFIVYDPNSKITDKLNGKVLKSFTFQTDHRQSLNPYFGDWGHCMMRKEGKRMTFFHAGQYYTFYVPEIESLSAAKIQISCKAWKLGNGKNLLMNGFDVFDFYKMDVESFRDVPNRYQAGSVLTIDGDSTSFLVNGMERSGDEVLGTEYFKADPGQTEISLTASSWYKGTLKGKAFIRERWI